MQFSMSISNLAQRHRGTEDKATFPPLCASVPLCANSPGFSRARRAFLRDAFCGFGSLALASLMQEQGRGASRNPLAAKSPPNVAKAKSVIFLFMAGGPSHIDTFDPKPLLNELDGQKKPADFGEAK